jgi:Pyridoxamine 5'-phosphate oxidase
VTASLPEAVRSVFERFITTELTTIDRQGQPITWPVTPYYSAGGPCIDVTTGLGYPKKANDARANPLVALLFSDPTGSGLDDPPMVLVQGTAEVDDHDLEANRDRYARESLQKLPGIRPLTPPRLIQRRLSWYYTRIYIHVRPERVYAWPGGDPAAEPELFGAHMEEVRSGHSEEPERFHADPQGGASAWQPRLAQLGARYPTAVLSFVSPDGFPFAIRVPVQADEAAGRIRIGGAPLGLPLQPGLACLTAHVHGETFSWQENFHVRGDLVFTGDTWVLVPRKLVGGFEIPSSRAKMLRLNASKALRFRRTAKRELRLRSQRHHNPAQEA